MHTRLSHRHAPLPTFAPPVNSIGMQFTLCLCDDTRNTSSEYVSLSLMHGFSQLICRTRPRSICHLSAVTSHLPADLGSAPALTRPPTGSPTTARQGLLTGLLLLLI